MVDVNAAVLIGFFLSDFDNTLKLLPCMLRNMKKANNDNEPFSFIPLAALTANVISFLELAKESEKNSEDNRPGDGHGDNGNPESAADIEKRLAEIAVIQRRIQKN